MVGLQYINYIFSFLKVQLLHTRVNVILKKEKCIGQIVLKTGARSFMQLVLHLTRNLMDLGSNPSLLFPSCHTRFVLLFKVIFLFCFVTFCTYDWSLLLDLKMPWNVYHSRTCMHGYQNCIYIILQM